MSKRILAVLLGMIWLSALTLYAHEGKVHIMGTITASDASHIVVKDRDGKTHSLLLTKDTKYWRGKTAVTAKDLKVGERIVIDVIGEAGNVIASEIRLGPQEMPADHTPMGKGAAKPKP